MGKYKLNESKKRLVKHRTNQATKSAMLSANIFYMLIQMFV